MQLETGWRRNKKARARNTNILGRPALNARDLFNFRVLAPGGTMILFQRSAHR
jgi:hypothetical protein